MRGRVFQPAIFGLAALSFLLPFAHVSCGGESPDSSGAPVEGAEGLEEGLDLKGHQLVVGRDVSEDFEDLFDELAMGEPDISVGADPFAVLALGAALAGIGVSLIGPLGRRARNGIVCGAAGAGALVILGLAPSVASTGLFTVSWGPGYWVCLALFLGATWLSYEEHRRNVRAARRRVSPPPVDASGSSSPRRPGPGPAPPAP